MSINSLRLQRSGLRLLRYAHSLLRGFLVVLLISIVVNAYLVTLYRVNGHSMEPTLSNGQVLVINQTAYWFKQPQRNDVVILAYAGDNTVHFVKRIIGVPGDTVTYNNAPLVLGASQYFVEGDNRDFSTDSRIYGPIDKSQILGKVIGQNPLPPADN